MTKFRIITNFLMMPVAFWKNIIEKLDKNNINLGDNDQLDVIIEYLILSFV